jgi:hypothetical protein
VDKDGLTHVGEAAKEANTPGTPQHSITNKPRVGATVTVATVTFDPRGVLLTSPGGTGWISDGCTATLHARVGAIHTQLNANKPINIPDVIAFVVAHIHKQDAGVPVQVPSFFCSFAPIPLIAISFFDCC